VRADAVEDLASALANNDIAGRYDVEERRRLAENALDVVQTRSCRLSKPSSSGEGGNTSPIRVLAPVFDFINHPSGSSANAEFLMVIDDNEEEERLVVRALRDVDAGEQVLISYGDSSKPAWKCLAAYGFVPIFPNDGDSADNYDHEQHIAEVYIDGVRYEVGPTTIPEDVVLAMSKRDVADVDPDEQQRENPVVTLTPEIALRLAGRLSEVSYQLLLDPLDRYSSEEEDDVTETPEDVLSAQLAASLRWNQHRILLTCSTGLQEWASDQTV